MLDELESEETPRLFRIVSLYNAMVLFVPLNADNLPEIVFVSCASPDVPIVSLIAVVLVLTVVMSVPPPDPPLSLMPLSRPITVFDELALFGAPTAELIAFVKLVEFRTLS